MEFDERQQALIKRIDEMQQDPQLMATDTHSYQVIRQQDPHLQAAKKWMHSFVTQAIFFGVTCISIVMYPDVLIWHWLMAVTSFLAICDVLAAGYCYRIGSRNVGNVYGQYLAQRYGGDAYGLYDSNSESKGQTGGH